MKATIIASTAGAVLTETRHPATGYVAWRTVYYGPLAVRFDGFTGSKPRLLVESGGVYQFATRTGEA